MPLELDTETFEALWYVSPWEAITELAHEQRERSLERQREHNASKPRAKRPALCRCGKPLIQNLGTRVRHFCSRRCARSKRSGRACAHCKGPLGKGVKWCSERCRKQASKAQANARRKLTRASRAKTKKGA